MTMQEEPYVWTKGWYPLAVADDLNPLKPFATKLLGAPQCTPQCTPNCTLHACSLHHCDF